MGEAESKIGVVVTNSQDFLKSLPRGRKAFLDFPAPGFLCLGCFPDRMRTLLAVPLPPALCLVDAQADIPAAQAIALFAKKKTL